MGVLADIAKIADQLPIPVLEDINGRIRDWLASGGKEDDAYIENQLKYAIRFISK